MYTVLCDEQNVPKERDGAQGREKSQEFSSEEFTVQNLLELLLLFKHTAAELVIGYHP